METVDQAHPLQIRLNELKIEHRDLDQAIMGLMSNPPLDDLLLRRLKKRKLQIKDKIVQIERILEPDIPA